MNAAAVFAQAERGAARIEAMVTGRRPVTPGHVDQARETRVSLNLMKNAAGAGPGMSDDQRIFLSQSSHGMRQRMAHLLTIPNRSLEEERELHMIDRGLAEVEGRPAPQGLLSALPLPLGLNLLASPMVWTVIAFAVPAAFGAVQTARLNHAKHDLDDARRAALQNAAAARTWEERAHAYEHATADAAAAARITTQTLEAERARARAAAARERRRQDELRQVNAGGSPPDWEHSLRNDNPSPDQSGPAATPAAGDPSGVRR